MGEATEREFSMREYTMRFGFNQCPNCKHRAVKIFQREKSGTKYTVYACGYCKNVIKREFTET